MQLGNAPALDAPETLQLIWQTSDRETDWSVEVQSGPASTPLGGWAKMSAPVMRRVFLPGLGPFCIYTATLTGLQPGSDFRYRVWKERSLAFSASASARKGYGQAYRFVVTGDTAAGTDGERQIAYRAYLSRPDLLVIAGDIVYRCGRVSEYLEKFFPVYNADLPSERAGAPLLRSTLFVAAPGNHDIGSTGQISVGNLGRFPDGLAYFLYWSQPLNGPVGIVGHLNTPIIEGPPDNQQAFLDAAGHKYPRMANFSFDYGNSHWTVLDGNPYMDWTDADLRAWVARDLAAAGQATWRFVCFHQPGFNSDLTHMNEQQMRLLSDVFEKGKVDIVFCGHAHNYQRSYPMQFALSREITDRPINPDGRVPGRWTLDWNFDGQERTRPDGIIYIVTGGGGAPLYGARMQQERSSWQEFTCKLIGDQYSLTVCDVKDRTLTLRQISASGAELDRITVKK